MPMRVMYQVWIDGVEAGSVRSVGDAWVLVLERAATAPIGAQLRYEVREGSVVVGAGEVDVSPSRARGRPGVR